MKRHVEVEHKFIYAKHSKKMVTYAGSALEWVLANKRPYVPFSVISSFFRSTNMFKKDNETQKAFLNYIMFFIIKGFLSLKIVESI
jgi:hypothetical protein